MDYISWYSRLQEFFRTLPQVKSNFQETLIEWEAHAPLTASQLENIIADCPLPIPGELQTFWTQVTRGCQYSYSLDEPNSTLAPKVAEVSGSGDRLYGGLWLVDANTVPALIVEHQDLADEWTEFPGQVEFWQKTIPFIAMMNGDYLALKSEPRQDDPTVVYLCHDDNSWILADSFTSFLLTWEQLCYIGPESWMLEPFRDEHGGLDVQSPVAEQLRSLFTR